MTRFEDEDEDDDDDDGNKDDEEETELPLEYNFLFEDIFNKKVECCTRNDDTFGC